MKPTVPAELRKLYHQGRVVPFIGAGASMSLSWQLRDGSSRRGPSWDEMVNEACRQLGYKDPELLRYRGTDLQILEFFEQKKGNFAPLTNWLVRRLEVPDVALTTSRVHSAIAELHVSTKFYTTNYDDLIERALRLAGREVKVVASERDMGWGDKMVEVIKFHGDFDNPDEMVFSEGHYYKRLSLNRPLDLKLRSDLLNRAALFVGYSFKDLNIGLAIITLTKLRLDVDIALLGASSNVRRPFRSDLS